jgi:hypothetical protein
MNLDIYRGGGASQNFSEIKKKFSKFQKEKNIYKYFRADPRQKVLLGSRRIVSTTGYLHRIII